MRENAAAIQPRPLLWRLGFFLRDFLPESDRQLIFLLGSFLLLLGWEQSLWVPAGFSRNAYILSNSVIRLSVRFAYTASIVLMCVPVRKPIQKIMSWVFLPVALGLLAALSMFLFWETGKDSVLDSQFQVIANRLRSLPPLFAGLRIGSYFIFAGIAVFAGSVWAIHARRVSLPLRFRGTRPVSETDTGGPALARMFFKILITSVVIVTLSEFITGYVLASLSDSALPIALMSFRWPADFSLSEWLQLLFGPAVVAFCALVVFGKDREGFPALTAASNSSGYLLAVTIPLAVSVGPRLLYKLAREFAFRLGGTRIGGFPPEWGDLFPFRAAPWILLIYLVAWLEEFVLRACLQERFEKRFGLKRAVFLTAISWWLLPLYGGLGPIPGLHTAVPGVAVVVGLGIYVLYNAPLAWLYARTRSIWPGSLMHGTMLFLRVSHSAYFIYYKFSAFYWIETAAWLVVTWFLFKGRSGNPAPWSNLILPDHSDAHQGS